MKGSILVTIISLSLSSVLLADQFQELAAQGYRWVNVNGPYACGAEKDVEKIVTHHTDANELDVVQNIRCYYLIPGTLVRLVKDDRARGMSQIQLGSIAPWVWTYSKFLSPRPVRDTYGVIETPENRFFPATNAANQKLQDDSNARTGKNEAP